LRSFSKTSQSTYHEEGRNTGINPFPAFLLSSFDRAFLALMKILEVALEGKQMARENLQLMLFLNLCKLMEMFPRQPDKLTLYMRQDLLENPESGDEPEPPVVPPTP
jgi:hypothetical protein